ncbi:MAG: GNAT family N-acetyltransferase [Turicibacter sp.]
MNHLKEGQLVYLSHMNEDHLGFVYNVYQDEEFMYDFGKMSENEKSIKAIKKWFVDCSLDDDIELLSIIEKKTNKIVGYIQLDDAGINSECVWLVIGIGPLSNQNQGFGKEAMALVLDYIFLTKDVVNVRLAVLSHNDRAIFMYEKLGFEVELTLPISRLFVQEIFDIFQLKLKRETWLKQRGLIR